jgi:hypothetical protein
LQPFRWRNKGRPLANQKSEPFEHEISEGGIVFEASLNRSKYQSVTSREKLHKLGSGNFNSIQSQITICVNGFCHLYELKFIDKKQQIHVVPSEDKQLNR